MVCLMALPARADVERGMRGITVGPVESSLQPNRGYGSDRSMALLKHLKRGGANWVSVTPFARLWSLTSTRIKMDFEAEYQENRTNLARMVAQAHALGLRVLLVPHLWVETGGWRGRVDPGSKRGWRAYHRSYRAFVLRWARFAADTGVDALSVGVECASWSGRFVEVWRSLIRDVRAVYGGTLTYSANWDEAANVIFWDRLDVVGVNAFFPLSDGKGASSDVYARYARRHADTLADLVESLGKPVFFSEVGYTTRKDAAVEPWLWPDDMVNVEIDEDEPARALRAVVDAFIPKEWFLGFFVWRYYANLDDVSQEARWGFSPHGKRAQHTLRRVFQARWR